MTIDSQGIRDRARLSHDDAPSTTSAHESLRHDTPCSRAVRVSLARAFPVRNSTLREALVNGSITKLARP